uniref:Cadherin domain-containing protein n=1 Tax=Eptatretus burgeri TaxID=7764 RepID=A0A8C4QTS9_EPTBU
MKKEKDARGRLIDKYGQVTTRQYLVFVLTLFLIKTGGAAWYPAGCEIVEHSPNGTRVNCTDPVCKNPSFESSIFRWDGHHIIVTDEKRLNRSTMNMSYVTLQVNCEEHLTKIMKIDVLDVNDFPPIFDKGSPSLINVSEFALPEQTIWTFNAADADWNPDLSPRFKFILKGFLTEKYLKVEGSTEASIILNKPLDYEHLKKEDLTLILSAEDYCNFPCVTNYPVKTSNFTFTIHIKEEDTLPPIFQPPYCMTFDVDGDNGNESQLACANAMYNGTVMHDTTTINMPTPIRAKDGDEQLNAPIAYRILGGNDEKIFSIGDDGKLTLNDTAKKKYNQTYNLEILAVQKNNNFRSALTTAKIRVIQQNNYPPKFCKGRCGYIPSTEYMVVVFECHSLSPLRVLVCDNDYPPQNINPNARVKLRSQDESWATLTPDGYLLVNMSNMPPRGGLSNVEVTAMDLETNEATI